MTDSNSPNHWDLLASNLGAKPPAEDAVLRQPNPLPPQALPPLKAPPRATRPASAPASTANWDLLASNLGVAPAPPQVAPPPPQVAPSPPQVAMSPPTSVSAVPASKPPVAKQGRRPSPAPDTPEESPNFFDERFDPEEPFDLLESSDATPASAPKKDEDQNELKEKQPKKRRRRRRSGKESERKDSHEPTSVEAAESSSAEAAALVEETREEDSDRASVVAAEEVVVEEVDSETVETGEHRPKRRRSRRGKKKGTGEETKTKPAVVAKSTAEKAGSRPARIHDEEKHDKKTAIVEDEEPVEDVESDDDRPARQGFRGIPTWDEAVGLIIAKNLEARAKRGGGGDSGGSSGSRQGRGGSRGSHEKRGGRGGKRRS